MELETPLHYVKLIDEKFLEARKNRWSRTSVEWGIWSREMNVVLRRAVNNKELDEELRRKYKYCFLYWQGVSGLLEMHHRNLFWLTRKRDKLKKDLIKVKKYIMGERSYEV